MACLLLLTAGCLKDHHLDNDPLIGGPVAPRGTADVAAGTPGAASTGQPAAGMPGMPVPASTTSAAALAGGVEQNLDPGSTLRIVGGTPSPQPGLPAGVLMSRPQPLNTNLPPPDPNQNPNTGTGFETSGTTPADAPAVSFTGVVEPVRGIDPPSVPTTPAPVPAPVASGPPAGGAQWAGEYQYLQDQLRARGINWQRLEQVGSDQWVFTCSIPDPSDASGVIKFKSLLPSGEHGLVAIREVLGEIDSQRHPGTVGQP